MIERIATAIPPCLGWLTLALFLCGRTPPRIPPAATRRPMIPCPRSPARLPRQRSVATRPGPTDGRCPPRGGSGHIHAVYGEPRPGAGRACPTRCRLSCWSSSCAYPSPARPHRLGPGTVGLSPGQAGLSISLMHNAPFAYSSCLLSRPILCHIVRHGDCKLTTSGSPVSQGSRPASDTGGDHRA
jgi:hypothetical protein